MPVLTPAEPDHGHGHELDALEVAYRRGCTDTIRVVCEELVRVGMPAAAEAVRDMHDTDPRPD